MESAETVLAAFQALRNGLSDRQWQQLEKMPYMEDLLTALMDLETEMEEG